ncbi:MAG: competence/damage-inducible protein A [Gemmatimonadales bacterium]|nr:competence/damage-inducible protein A [Gemmatimonadales bacterium]
MTSLELVTIGTELLLGFTVDTNSAFLGQAFAEAGVRVARRTSVPDDPEAVREAVREALARTGFVVTTGGLGPTRDDLSKKVVADLLRLPLVFRPEIWDELSARWARMGRTINDRNRSQAEVPQGATVLPNRWGTAPGLWIAAAEGVVVMLPGVPLEMRGLVTHEVVPRLASMGRGLVVRSLTLRTTGIPESLLAEQVSAVEDGIAPLTLAYLPSLEGVDLRLTAWNLPPEAAAAALQEAAARFRAVVGNQCYGAGDDDLAAVLLAACRSAGLTLALAESCTGGMIAERITAVPGSSDAFLGGEVCYANSAKERLGVPPRILEEHGAVSEEAVRAMAPLARAKFGADLTVAVSGIAGPSGGSAEKPVGTVWFAFADAGGVETRRVNFPGTRHEIRARASQYALFGLLSRAKSAGAGGMGVARLNTTLP